MPEDDGLNATDVPTIDIEGLEESVFELARQRCGAPSSVSNANDTVYHRQQHRPEDALGEY